MNFRQEFERKKGCLAQLHKDHDSVSEKISQYSKQIRDYEKAQEIVKIVAQATQQELEYHINELVTLAMTAVFNDPYEMKIEFVLRRGRTEADIYFVRDGKQINPLEESGGGAVDVASFALQVAVWCLPSKQKRTRNVLVLDEPLKWLKGGDLPERGAMMIKEISEKLNLQIVMISHIPNQIEGADKVIEIELKKGVSSAKSV